MQRALRDTIHSSTIVSKCIGDDGNILNSKQEKKEEIWLSHDKSPYAHRKIHKATWQYKNVSQLHNDCDST